MTDSIGVAVIGAGMAGRAHAAGYRSASTVYGEGLPETEFTLMPGTDRRLTVRLAIVADPKRCTGPIVRISSRNSSALVASRC